MGLLFLIDIAGNIRLMFSLNDGIIIHHMMTQSSLSDSGQIGQAFLVLIIH